MNEIVKHRNELNDFELGKLSPNQANLFTYLVYKIKDKDKVVISYDEAMEKLDLPKEHRYFKKLLLQSYNKIMDMKYYNIKISENGNTSGSVSHIFDEFEWDDDTEKISLEVNKKNKSFLHSFTPILKSRKWLLPMFKSCFRSNFLAN